MNDLTAELEFMCPECNGAAFRVVMRRVSFDDIYVVLNKETGEFLEIIEDGKTHSSEGWPADNIATCRNCEAQYRLPGLEKIKEDEND